MVPCVRGGPVVPEGMGGGDSLPWAAGAARLFLILDAKGSSPSCWQALISAWGVRGDLGLMSGPEAGRRGRDHQRGVLDRGQRCPPHIARSCAPGHCGEGYGPLLQMSHQQACENSWDQTHAISSCARDVPEKKAGSQECFCLSPSVLYLESSRWSPPWASPFHGLLGEPGPGARSCALWEAVHPK